MSNYTKSTNFATKDNLTPGDPLKVVRGTEIDTEFNNIATAVATKTDNSAAAITGGSITGITDLAVADGGTGASTAAGALNNLLPSQTSAANKYLQSDGTNASWDAVTLSTADITGTLPVANGGTGVTSSTGTGNVVLSNSPTLVTPALGTPASGTLTNATGLPISTGVSGLGTGVATFLGTPSSANLISAVTDETGTGSLVFATSPTLVTPALGTPSALVGTNITGTASGLTAGNVTTNANLTGAITSVGNATSLGSFTSSQLATALSDETGSGSAVFATSPTLVTPILGTPTSATLTNATGLPISTGVSGLGTGVATFLATPSSANLAAALTDETGSGANVFATSPTLVTPILGTPTSATLTNATGLPLTTGVTGTLPTANGGTNLTSFTSGGVVYASSSSALATGSALTFNGSTLAITSAANDLITWASGGSAKTGFLYSDSAGIGIGDTALLTGNNTYYNKTSNYIANYINGTEALRLTSSSLYTASGINVGIGVSSVTNKLTIGTGTFATPATGTAGLYATTAAGLVVIADGFVVASRVGTDFLKVDSSGNLGLGVTPSASNLVTFQSEYGLFTGNSQVNILQNAYYNSGFLFTGTGYATQYQQLSGQHIWKTSTASGSANGAISFTQAMTLDADGDLGIGETSPAARLDLKSSATDFTGVILNNTSTNGKKYNIVSAGSGSYFDIPPGAFGIRDLTASATRLVIDTSGNLGVGTTSPTARLSIGDSGTGLDFTNAASGNFNIGLLAGTGSALAYIFQRANSDLLFGTNNTERARITSSGNLLVGTTSSSFRFVVANSSASAMVYVGPASLSTSGGENAADAMMKFRADTTTVRSINAAGTINAAGLDYAEYMTKASDFNVAKGDVVGVDSQGKLTNVFSNAISFVVKSTNPSYVGGDTWGSGFDDDAEGLEAARQLVDRIAFSGQVPVNVLGATAGQYIIPINDNGAIKGQAISNPTFEQYQSAVGKVIAIEADGRARIIVKVA